MAASSSSLSISLNIDENAQFEAVLKKYRENPTQIPTYKDLAVMNNLFSQYCASNPRRVALCLDASERGKLDEPILEAERILYRKYVNFLISF